MNEIDDAKQEAWRIEQSVLDKRDAEIYRLKKLITELCDALEWWENHTSYEPPFAVELKKRAREATR